MGDIKPKVIIVTDGDKVAKNTIELIAKKVGGRCISASAGNPTSLSGPQIVKLIKMAPTEPVFVMFDDKGHRGKGKGEQALEYLLKSNEIEILGIIAVASATKGTKGIKVDLLITKEGKIVKQAVDKDGNLKLLKPEILEGDTVDVLNGSSIPIVVGIGDIGKMEGYDSLKKESPVTTKAVKEILSRSGCLYDQNLR